ncbi:MAG: leucyl aminopeptidase family protein [Caulobacteraceae bacterium]
MQAATDVLIRAAMGAAPTPIHLIVDADLAATMAKAGPRAEAYVAAHGFTAKAGQILAAPADEDGPARVLFGLGATPNVMALRALAAGLQPGDYIIASAPDSIDPTQAALAFALGSYRFDRYKADHGKPRPRLVAGHTVDIDAVLAMAHACDLARDMVNTPANDMGPLQIETIAREISKTYSASISVTTGDDLIRSHYPAVHAVGRAASAARAPRLIEMYWDGGGDGPLICLIGKGVTFDTGGLDIKPSAGMRNMKKDMGGAAHALALARMIMAAKLPVRLSVIVPAVENAISADAMRPGDVIASRKDLSIEIGNTDAEGRLILADALTMASEMDADLTIDLATLTGAARVALGPDIAPFYTDDDALAADLTAAALKVSDPVWRMPLWAGYADALNSDIADLKNDADAWAQAGSVTAALFLKRFAPTRGSWLHLDIFAWNARSRAGYPVGGEVQSIRALFHMLKARYSA